MQLKLKRTKAPLEKTQAPRVKFKKVQIKIKSPTKPTTTITIHQFKEKPCLSVCISSNLFQIKKVIRCKIRVLIDFISDVKFTFIKFLTLLNRL